MKNDVVLSVDCGTQSLRTLLFDVEGNLLGKAKMEYEPYFSLQPGWAEKDAEEFWTALIEGCRRLKEEFPDLFSRISGVGITSQRDSMICLGKDGNPLRAAITWLDTRKAPVHYKGKWPLNLIYRVLGVNKVIKKTQSDGQSNWIRANEPEIWEKTWKYVEVSGFLNYRLTGKPVDSIASMVGHIPISHKKRGWAGPHDLKSKVFPLPEVLKYETVEPGTLIGKITQTAARATGLPEDLPVFACGSDKSCETLGVGSLDTRLASLSFGTTATVEVTSSRYFEPLPYLPAYCGAVPGSWVPEVEIFRGYWMVSWFRNQLGSREIEEARLKGKSPEEVLDCLLDKSPAGNKGLILQPYWGAGLKDPQARGSMIGFGDVHDRSAIYRAIVEGLAYALRDGLEVLEKRGRFKSPQLGVSGGASKSERVCQITANIMGRPLVRGRTYEASGLGAAIVISVGLGLYESFEEAVGQMVHHEKTFYPQVAETALYSRLFRSYKKIYPHMKNLYREIQEITGYPEI